ncbi:hypothetical protein [Halomarina rubra]|uniref:Uncharacterized protein n=1 Tax=Halomarina rubra TaxID=2071873 RepID=A0ABD6AW68_9EURY|nr:hypothetical protein [Halomarina rubra]
MKSDSPPAIAIDDVELYRGYPQRFDVTLFDVAQFRLWVESRGGDASTSGLQWRLVSVAPVYPTSLQVEPPLYRWRAGRRHDRVDVTVELRSAGDVALGTRTVVVESWHTLDGDPDERVAATVTLVDQPGWMEW